MSQIAQHNEETRVQVPAALHLTRLGYQYLDNLPDYDHRTNILKSVFNESLSRLNPGKSSAELSRVLPQLIELADNDDLGRAFYRELTQTAGIRLIDYDHTENNAWHVTTEMECNNEEQGMMFRPDITCFVNGIPVAFIEVKKPNNNDGILRERDRIDWRMQQRAFRRFLNVTQLMIFSNNQEYDTDNVVPIQGAFYATTARNNAFFNVFREQQRDFVEKYPYLELNPETEARILRHRNCQVVRNTKEYKTNCAVTTPTNRIITSMLSPARLLFLLRYGIAYVDKTIELPDGTHSTSLEKHIMRYQQMFASFAIRRMLDAGRKGGIIWHTQGSGKTALAYYSVRNLTDYYAERNTAAKFYFIVDRLDLMEQASDEFQARGLVVYNASDRKTLMDDIRSTDLVRNSEGRPEIMVVNIQRFSSTEITELRNLNNTNLQRIFFIDEAHRDYNPHGTFLANLMEADRESVKIALTGTPLLRDERESWRVFGDYIDKYYYDKSIADGYTLRLMREPVETEYREMINDVIDGIAKEIKVRRRDVDERDIIEHDRYLNALLDYIIRDFRRFRVEQDDNTAGAMIICATNAQARNIYRLWQERFHFAQKADERNREEGMHAEDPMVDYQAIKQPLRAELILHDEGDSEERKQKVAAFKKSGTVDVLIVNAMLLTGFDAPRLKKLYLGRKLDGHTLLQALTRVNRPYHDFRYGYVVDFVDIRENFDETNERYLNELVSTTDPDDQQSVDSAAGLMLSPEEIIDELNDLADVLFNYTIDNVEQFRNELDEINDRDTLYRLRSQLSRAQAIINNVRSMGSQELREQVRNLTPDALPKLVAEVNNRIGRFNQIENNDHQADVAGIVNTILNEISYHFRRGIPEELAIVLGDLREQFNRVRMEFEANFDQEEEQYITLSEAFRAYFREHGFVPRSLAEAREGLNYLKEVMEKIKEINRRNNVLKSKYENDEKFVRVHKRVWEENQKPRTGGPMISAREVDICHALLTMKHEIDRQVELNENILENDNAFRRDSMSKLRDVLLNLEIVSDLTDRKFINNQIVKQYSQQYAG